jgi:iron complex transport system permease protein
MSHIKEKWKNDLSLRRDYHNLIGKRISLLLFLFVLVLLFAIISIQVGAYHLDFISVVNSLFGRGEATSDIIIWNLRMPRTIAAIVSGMALSLSGVVIQTFLRNPLASPSTLGVSQGAAFGASFAIVVLGAANLGESAFRTSDAYHFEIFSWYSISICAFLGSLSVVLIVWGLQKLRRMTSATVILAGVALSSLFVSGTILIQYFADEVEIAAAIFWTFGDVSRSTWIEIGLLALFLLPSLVYFIVKSQSLNAIATGDDNALNLGVEVDRFRLIGLIIAALLAAFTTSFHGVIAFLGLLAPHIARRLTGNNHLFLIPCSVFVGAILLLISDLLGRIVIGGGTLPVGVITSFLGAPLFLYLLLSGKNYVGR